MRTTLPAVAAPFGYFSLSIRSLRTTPPRLRMNAACV